LLIHQTAQHPIGGLFGLFRCQIAAEFGQLEIELMHGDLVTANLGGDLGGLLRLALFLVAAAVQDERQ
jgi:hypothetical protein